MLHTLTGAGAHRHVSRVSGQFRSLSFGNRRRRALEIGEHLVPVYFVILDMGEGSKAPLILGRPFLKTARANIDVGKGEMR